MSNTFSEQAIIDGLLHGDESVLQRLYSQMGPRVLGYVVKNSGTEEEGHEVLQDTIVAVWENIKSGKYQSAGKFEGYFMQIAVYTWRGKLRVKKGQKEESLTGKDYQLGDTSFEEHEARQEEEKKLIAIENALQTLDAICQELIRLFHYENVPLKALADKMGMEYGTVRKRIYDCRTRLKKKVVDLF